MKKSFYFLCTLLASLSASAQEKIYICDGFLVTPIELASTNEIFVSDGKKHITIGENKFDIEDIDSITTEAPLFKEVKIRYNGETAIVEIADNVKGVTYSQNGANVTLTSTNTTDEILYRISGSSQNGSLTINGEYKLTVALDGLELSSTTDKAPIDIECGKRINLIIEAGTVNNISDTKSNVAKGAIYTSGHLEVEGKGTLNVTGNSKHAICAKEYLQIKKNAGIINILGAVSDGLHCGKGKKNDDNNYFQINGGKITISNAGSDCIDADDYGCAIIKGGELVLNVSQADGTGLKADSCIYMTDGSITVNVTGNISEGIRASYAGYFNGGTISETVAGNGSRGIRAKKTTKTTDTVLNGGYLYFNGTNADIIVSGSTYAGDNTVCYGIKADKEFQQTAGEINITLKSADAATKAYNFKSNSSTGGSINLK